MPDTMDLVVSRLTHEAQDVVGIELRSPNRELLPEFTAGAHVDLTLPGGLCRQYSLLNAPSERHRYVLGVGLAPQSRGASTFIHQRLAIGDLVQVGEPRSLFGLVPAASEHVLIAGGIGITPILSMIAWCETNRRPWRLLYCVRSRARAAYAWDLATYGQRVRLHVDEEADGALPDLRAWVESGVDGAHVYCCGPAGLMDGVELACAEAGIPRDHTHFERFVAPASPAASAIENGAFSVRLNRSGRKINVQPDQSLLDALEAAQVSLPYSCREGLCRSCEVPLLQGQADHRDFVLSEEERASHRCILPCVSRAFSPELVLDL